MKSQKPGCGFPMARMIGFFSLATGTFIRFTIGSYTGRQTGETSLLRSIFDRLLPGRILLADRYCASFSLHAEGERRGVEFVSMSTVW